MPKYMTKQRKLLIEYLSGHIDESICANRIAEDLATKISKSAVYRNLADLEAEGKLRRIADNNTREVVYQYVDEDKCRECLHLSCKKCGKTYHMSMTAADSLVDNVSKSESFVIDKEKTVLYGVCKECMKEE